MADSKERLAILISGGGTTMDRMIEAMQDTKGRPYLAKGIELAAVIASRDDAGGIDKALARGILEKDIVIIDPRNYRGPDGKRSQDLFGNRLAEEFRAREVTVYTQNGWLPVTPDLEAKGYNQHPGDPREFGGIYGRQVHAAVLDFSDNVARLSEDRQVSTWPAAHEVTSVVDGGAIVLFDSVSVPRPMPEDLELTGEKAEARFRERVADLQGRVLQVEHQVQIELLMHIAEGRVRPREMVSHVLPGEEGIRDAAKVRAVQLYPNG